MVGRFVRITGTVLAIGVAFVIPILVTTTTPAAADIVFNGCTIVSNPSATHYTNCPNANLAGAAFSGVDLSFANLAGATFATCTQSLPPTCVSSSLGDVDLTRANLSGATFGACVFLSVTPAATCGRTDLSDADLSSADLSGVSFGASFNGADLVGANLTDATLGGDDLTNANLTGANLTGTAFSANLIVPVYANLTGANLTGTLLVPTNQSVAATSQAGAVATWTTPAAIPGATPGSCMPASGSAFPLFSSTVTCRVLDFNDDVATGTFQVNVQPTSRYFIQIASPSNGAVVGSKTFLDAAAADVPGVIKVVYQLTGETLKNHVIAKATPTYFGWLAKWDTTKVPNGTYTLMAVGTDAAGHIDRSTPVTLTVSN
jgi:uncharacterized protein YjbI with pentapeptide repeats